MQSRTLTLYQTTIGKKVVMAASGIILVGFVFAHMLGNLQVYGGADMLNAYAAGLRKIPALLWVARLVLLGAVFAHAWSAIQLTQLNRQARPQSYRVKKNLTTNPAAVTMVFGGLALALFIVYHVAHLTVGVGVPGGFDHTNVYGNVIASFSVWWITAIYMLAQIALGLHLYHGTWSLFQTLGLNHPRYNAMRRTLATGLSGLVLIGNISIPVSVLTGIVS